MSTTRNVNIDLNANGQDDQNGQQGYNPDGNVNISSQVPEQFKGSTNSELIDWLEKKIDERKPMSNEDLEKLRKKQKAEGIISGISDAVMSISNLLTTTRYAPNIESASKGVMSDAAKARWDKAKAEREAKEDKWFQYVMARRKMDNEDAATEYQHGRDSIQDSIRMSAEARAQAKANRDAQMADLKMQLLAGKINEQEYQTQVAQAEADYAEAYWQSKIDVNKSQKNKNDRWQPSRGGSGSRGSGKPAEHAWRDKDGNLHYAHSESAARSQAAANGGTYVTTPTTTTTTKKDAFGRDQTTTSTRDVSTPKITIGW